jgi:alpha-1,3-glucosyltransferase
MFPVARGIFEDKVANFWCVSHVLIKWRSYFTDPQLAALSAALTLAFSLPSTVDLLLRPTTRRFIYSLTSVSLAFFLFSFQVHEKNILFVTAPLSLLFLYHPSLITLTSIVSAHTCFPLLQRDGLAGVYFVVMGGYILYSYIKSIRLNSVALPFSYFPALTASSASASAPAPASLASRRQDVPFPCKGSKLLMMAAIHVAAYLLPKDGRYPHLGDLLFAAHGFVSFFMVYVFITYYQICVLPANGSLGNKNKRD